VEPTARAKPSCTLTKACVVEIVDGVFRRVFEAHTTRLTPQHALVDVRNFSDTNNDVIARAAAH
jgi:hypothetical protein